MLESYIKICPADAYMQNRYQTEYENNGWNVEVKKKKSTLLKRMLGESKHCWWGIWFDCFHWQTQICYLENSATICLQLDSFER